MDFDPTGRSMGKFKNRDAWKDMFESSYRPAHKEAMEAEYRLLLDEIEDITGYRMSMPEVAVADSNRMGRQIPHEYNAPEPFEFKYNRPDFEGVWINQHKHFDVWIKRATEEVEIPSSTRRKMGLPNGPVAKFQLVAAVKNLKIRK